MKKVDKYTQLQKQLQIQFKNQDLLKQAFTHSSYINEHTGEKVHNERLEYLGDSVIELTVSHYLYETYPDKSEGMLTKLRASIVCETSLAKFANLLNFGYYLKLGNTVKQYGLSILADTFEAFVGALYLDQGLSAVDDFMKRIVYPRIEQLSSDEFNYRGQLQELVVKEGNTIEYKVKRDSDLFSSCVLINGIKMGSGTGRTKKEASRAAAKVVYLNRVKG